MANETETKMKIVLPKSKYIDLLDSFENRIEDKSNGYIKADLTNDKVLDANEYGMLSCELKMSCRWKCEDTLFNPYEDECPKALSLEEIIKKFEIKRLSVWSVETGNGFYESAYYDSSKSNDATIDYDEGNLPRLYSGIDSYVSVFDKSSNFFDKDCKTYHEQEDKDYNKWESDLDDDFLDDDLLINDEGLDEEME